MEISKHLAKQIVSAAADVINADINLINYDGIIIGSTETKRIGTFHEAGYNAVKTSKPITVTADKVSKHVKEGINYPIFLDNKPIAVIGITGKPLKVSKYGFLVTKITEVFLKEQVLNDEISSRERMISNLVSSLIQGSISDTERMTALLNKFGSSLSDSCRVLSVTTFTDGVVPSLKHYFTSREIHFMLYIYPNELVVLLDTSGMDRFNNSDFIETYAGHVAAGIGTLVSLSKAHLSYEQAVMARQYIYNKNETLCDSDELTATLLLSDISSDIKESFTSKVLTMLNDRELHILQTYLDSDLSLKAASESLHIHKNTLQYQLDRITEKSGYNPRMFHDAFLLNLAMLLSHITN